MVQPALSPRAKQLRTIAKDGLSLATLLAQDHVLASAAVDAAAAGSADDFARAQAALGIFPKILDTAKAEAASPDGDYVDALFARTDEWRSKGKITRRRESWLDLAPGSDTSDARHGVEHRILVLVDRLLDQPSWQARVVAGPKYALTQAFLIDLAEPLTLLIRGIPWYHQMEPELRDWQAPEPHELEEGGSPIAVADAIGELSVAQMSYYLKATWDSIAIETLWAYARVANAARKVKPHLLAWNDSGGPVAREIADSLHTIDAVSPFQELEVSALRHATRTGEFAPFLEYLEERGQLSLARWVTWLRTCECPQPKRGTPYEPDTMFCKPHRMWQACYHIIALALDPQALPPMEQDAFERALYLPSTDEMMIQWMRAAQQDQALF